MRTYENIRKTATGSENDYAISFLLDCPYLKESYKFIVIDFNKEQVLDEDLKNNTTN